MEETRPLRIALQIERFSPGAGGAEGYARDLARGLVARGQEVTVIALRGSEPPDGVRLELVGSDRYPKFIRDLLFARKSAELARQGSFDIVHALGKSLGMNVLNPHGGVQAVWLRQERRSRRTLLAQAIWVFKRQLSLRHHALQAILRRQYRDPGVLRLVALSYAIADAMVSVHGVDREKIVVLPNQVDPARFRPAMDAQEKAELRARLEIPADHLLFLFVGHNFRLKGLEALIAALGKLRAESPPLTVAVLGRGKEAPYLRRARALGVEKSITFVGPVSDIHRWYRAADAHLHPTFYDACSLALQEAMASGLAVLASTHDGSAELVTDGLEGVLVRDPADEEELAAGLRRLFDADFRSHAGEAARERMTREEYCEPAEAMLEIYLGALASAG